MEKRNRHSVKRNLLRGEAEIRYPTIKTCSRCGSTKAACDFNKAKRETDGLKANCKACTAVQWRDWYRRNKEHCVQKAAVWQKSNPEKKCEIAKRTYYKHHASRRSRLKMGYEATKETRLDCEKQRYKCDAEYRKKKIANSRSNYQKNPAKSIALHKLRDKMFPEKASVHVNNRRTRMRNAVGKITADQWIERLEEFNYCCAYCLKPEGGKTKMTMEHMTPLSQGGTNDIDNIVPACRPCNSSKNKKNLLEYLAYKSERSAA